MSVFKNFNMPGFFKGLEFRGNSIGLKLALFSVYSGGNMRKQEVLLLFFLLVPLFQNCAQKVGFKTEGGATLDSQGGDPGNDPSLPVATPTPAADSGSGSIESFKVTYSKEAAPLDMIWVIDNSGSMTEEAERVRNNFSAFLTSLNTSTNFRLLLVSATAQMSNAGVTLPANFDPNTHLQVQRYISSTDGPRVLLETLQSQVPTGFLRSDSKKVIVFVTDDAPSMLARDFFSSLETQQHWPLQDVSVSAFIGLGKDQSPCQDNTGSEYMAMASQTLGRTYNICAQDWSSHFSNLINVSVAKASRRFTLQGASVSQILEITVNGAPVASSLYSLSGKVVTLADSVDLPENAEVRIRYK